jgi:serine/threonine protein phosphatase PrpC
MSEPTIQSDVAVMDTRNIVTLDLPADVPSLSVRSFGLTHPGKVRPQNEDQFLIATLAKALQVQQTSLPQPKVQFSHERGHLFVVADGMGGHLGGERASALVLDSIEGFALNTLKYFYHLKGSEADQVLVEFQQALGKADAALFAESARHPELHGMGTTLTMAYSLNNDLFVAHVGDSRAYLYRENSLYQLTRDHTMVAEMVRRGVIQPAEAVKHRLRHLITNSVGGSEQGVQVEIDKARLEPDDVVLLCSDGLTEMVPDDQIAETLQDETDPRRACERLVALANDHGGKDNVTVIIARYEAPATPDAA